VAGISPSELELTTFSLDSSEGDELSLLIPGDAFALTLNRLDELPARCNEQVPRDAQSVFDYLWNTFDQFYAFFELRGVDWDAEFARQSVRIADVENDADLFSLLSDLLSPIDDDYVFLQGDEDGQFFTPAVESGGLPELREGFEAQSEITDFGDFIDQALVQLEQTIGSRMDSGSINQQGPLTWATANEGATGYLFIEGMFGFTENGSDFDELQAARQAMDQVMSDLATTSRMIVDVRINGGGLDAIALDFASRFASNTQLAFSKTARGRNFESDPVQAFLIPPDSGAYLNPVTLIVGADTRGAAEVFAIPMHRQPQVTVIGWTKP